MPQAFHLARYLEAQADSYETALAEIRAGCKRSHWMWFIFPQISGLGSSPTACFYAIQSLEEARAYMEEPALGGRMRTCLQTLLALETNDAVALFGPLDALKLRSSLTLFDLACPEEQMFSQALDKFFQGKKDPLTLKLAK